MNAPTMSNGKQAAARPQAQAQSWTDDLDDALLALAPYAVGGLVAAVAVVGAIAAAVAQPAWLSRLAASLAGVEPKAYWYLSRSSAIVGYFMLWASMVLGLAITNKLARAWPAAPPSPRCTSTPAGWAWCCRPFTRSSCSAMATSATT